MEAPRPADAPGAHGATLTSTVVYWTQLMLDHALPGTLFSLIAYSQLLLVVQIIRGEDLGAGLDSTTAFWLAAQKSLAFAFYLLAALLFVTRVRRRGPRTGPLGALVALGGTCVFYLYGLLPTVDPSPERTIPGLVLLCIGLAFAIVSLASLGRCFGIFPEARGLVTRGPYASIRHPLYLAETIAAVGLILPALSVFSVGLLLVFVALQYARAVLEERALVQAIPEYAEYQRHTWRILPGIH